MNIAPRKSAELQNAIKPYLSEERREAVLVDGKTPEAKAQQTAFRFYKAFEGLPQAENMKVDVSENRSALLPSAYTEVEGVKVATVPLMVIFKICAISRQNRSAHAEKLNKDLDDLTTAVEYLEARHEVVPDELQALFYQEQPPFSWDAFWTVLNDSDSNQGHAETLEASLHALGIKKVCYQIGRAHV